MKSSQTVLQAGARNSKLSLAQTEQAFAKLKELLPVLDFEIISFSSPGDRDKKTDLRESDADFFTRDLDDAVLSGEIDCAVHSAKDLPQELREGLDVLYFPWAEDRRDVLIYPKGAANAPRIGISSKRREEYAAKRFSAGKTLPIRGNIDDRIAQLDRGEYDVLIMAAAGLVRLGLADRISEYIPLEELTPPPDQGRLAMVFKKGNSTFTLLRKLFVKPLVFAGAGVGTKENTTLGTIEALKNCDVCLYDALCPQELLDYLPCGAQAIYVGKRSGKHSYSQTEICRMLLDYARKGKRVVRLKGGDPGIFGRLAEEIAVLDEYELPYRVLPGISSLTAATTSTGLLLTRRGTARGFNVFSPRKSGSSDIEWLSDEEKSEMPQVFFMGVGKLKGICEQLLAEGRNSATPVAVVFNAGYPDQKIINGTIENITDKMPDASMPGIIIVGDIANRDFIFREHGVFAGKRILFAGSEALKTKAERNIREFGGIPVSMPMIELESCLKEAEIKEISKADWIIVNSPSSAEFLVESGVDLRKLPKIAVCGKQTAAIFEARGIKPEICPEKDFGAAELLKSIKGELKKSDRVVRLCSDKSDSLLTDELKKIAPDTGELISYNNKPVTYDSLPEFDAVLFTSPSTVESFVSNFSITSLKSKKICVIGKPTEKTLKELLPEASVIKGTEATVEDMIFTLAAEYVKSDLKGDDK